MNHTLCACGLNHVNGANCRPAPMQTPVADKRHCCHEHATDEPSDRHGGQTSAPPLNMADRAATVVYHIANMDCPMEETLIRKKLGSLPGIERLEFNLIKRLLTVEHKLTSTLPIEAALSAIDMKPQPFTQSSQPAPIAWRKLGLALALALAAELCHFLPNLFGVGANALEIGGVAFLEWLPLALALAAIMLAGLGTYKKGWIAVKNLDLNMNALMSVAVSGAFIIGQYPEAAMVMVLFNLAEAIEARSLNRARQAIQKLLDLAPAMASVQMPDASWQQIDVRQIMPGSRVRVKPGERIALDGVIVKGGSSINQAPITGESLPVEKTVGDQVFAGTINENDSFEFQVKAPFNNTTLARIIQAVEQAQASRAPVQRFIDKFARIYTPAIFLLALLCAFVPPLMWAAPWQQWIYTALVILVIGCPCALVISTPISIVSGLAAATRQGMLVKGGLYLELARKLGYLALDKTGTITHGQPRQTDLIVLGMDEQQASVLAASLAARSDHPVSKAIATANNGGQLHEVDKFSAIPGQGISGVINGRQWHLGNQRMLRELGLPAAQIADQALALEMQGKSVVILADAHGARALLAVADTIKPGSIEAISQLKRMGIKTVMLTGDNQHIAQAIASQAGVDDFKAGLLPQDKLRAVEELGKSGKVGMVGDGINDAPALAKADIGFAMAAAGTDTAIETADVALMDDDLRKIPRFIRLSRATHTILLQNISFALGIKAIFLTLAFMGMASMWMAVFADVGASLLVVLNGLRAMEK